MSQVIKRPIVTEKSSALIEKGIYAFEVNRKATKIEIKADIEKYFNVKVSEVRTCIARNKSRKTRLGMRPVKYWKKALVRLKKGEKLQVFEGS